MHLKHLAVRDRIYIRNVNLYNPCNDTHKVNKPEL